MSQDTALQSEFPAQVLTQASQTLAVVVVGAAVSIHFPESPREYIWGFGVENTGPKIGPRTGSLIVNAGMYVVHAQSSKG